MASPKLTKEQHEKQLAGIAAELERRKANNNAGKQITAKGFLKREQKAALAIIAQVNKGIPNPMPKDYVHPSKTELDNAWKIVNAVRDYDKHDVALKIAKLAAQKAEHEAKTAGYGEAAPEALKRKADENNGRPRLALTMQKVVEDEDYEDSEDE